MAKQERIGFSYQDIVECLVKKAGIHEGIWGISLGFGITGANINREKDLDNFMPAAIIPVTEIGIQPFDKPSNLTVDAAVVNPRPKTKSSKSKSNKS